MNERAGARFIHDRLDSELKDSHPVEYEHKRRENKTVRLKEASGIKLTPEQIKEAGLETSSQKPAIRLSNWFEVLERTHLARGASPERQAKHEKVMERIKNSYHKLFVIKPENIPESYFALEVRIARERGAGNIPPYDEYKQQKTKEAIEAQKSSLDRWVDYLTSEDADAAGYPMWARYWAFMSITKMGLMEKKTILPKEPGGEETIEISFGDRGNPSTTVAPFPSLNPKALAKTFEAMQKHLEQQGLPKAERRVDNTSKVLSDAQFAQMLSEGSFAKLYGQFLAENPSISVETLKETRGEWVRYEQGSDATELFDSLQDHTLEWCTAGAVNTAQRQVDGGDFYVYYSLDDFGEPTIPRIAIRKEGNRIAEIRGIEHNQNLDPYIGGVLQEKLEDEQAFPNAEEYLQGVEDMQRVTDIEKQMGAKYKDIEADFLGYDNPSAELSREDLRFIYKMDRKIISLGYGKDPRIEQILQNRELMGDLEIIYEKSNQAEIVDAMLEHGDYYFLVNNIDFFDELDQNQIAQQLIDNGQGEAVANNLYKFPDLERNNELAQKLIEAGGGNGVTNNLYYFQGLDNTTAQKLIDNGEGWAVARNLNNFQGLYHNEIAQQLIDTDQAEAVVRNLDKFPNLERNNELAQKLIEAGGGNGVAYSLDKFPNLERNNELAQKLIEAGGGDGVAYNLDKFPDLDNTTAQMLIDNGRGWEVVENLNKFPDLECNNELAQKLIEAGGGKAVAENLDKFQGLDNTTAQQLIDAGQGEAVAKYLYRFQGLDHNEIAQQLIATRQGDAVAYNLDKFPDLECNNELAQKLIEAGGGNGVADNLDKFPDLECNNELAQKLIEAGGGDAVAYNLDIFQGLDYNQIAQQLIDKSYGDAVAKYLYNFQGLDNTIAQHLIDIGEGIAVAIGLNSFQDLSSETMEQLEPYL